ncbi:hypothetical protein OH76DRAFT_713484 [Lentinus brumalis]|uniref:Uncharacterized protein n=1 Tax=Lentinus brumalis TaxID=2498619 RepID=A0A371D5I3_9APHY|nr:hypothetical protein OH76DRAFT_713484 [Polyporus brumalis]
MYSVSHRFGLCLIAGRSLKAQHEKCPSPRVFQSSLSSSLGLYNPPCDSCGSCAVGHRTAALKLKSHVTERRRMGTASPASLPRRRTSNTGRSVKLVAVGDEHTWKCYVVVVMRSCG